MGAAVVLHELGYVISNTYLDSLQTSEVRSVQQSAMVVAPIQNEVSSLSRTPESVMSGKLQAKLTVEIMSSFEGRKVDASGSSEDDVATVGAGTTDASA